MNGLEAEECQSELTIEDTESTALDATVDAEVRRLVPEKFCVRCPQTAAWVVRKVSAARRYAEQVKLWSQLELQRAAREEQQLLYLFGDQLQCWAEAEILKQKGKRKSVALPGGTVGFRTVKSSLVIDDEQLVLDWARSACPSAVVISERISKSAVNEHVATTGELPVAGAHIEPERQKFFIS